MDRKKMVREAAWQHGIYVMLILIACFSLFLIAIYFIVPRPVNRCAPPYKWPGELCPQPRAPSPPE